MLKAEDLSQPFMMVLEKLQCPQSLESLSAARSRGETQVLIPLNPHFPEQPPQTHQRPDRAPRWQRQGSTCGFPALHFSHASAPKCRVESGVSLNKVRACKLPRTHQCERSGFHVALADLR